jgi:cysteine-rich repeat protein
MAVLVGSSGSGRVLRTAPALLLMWACLGLPSTAMALPGYGNVGDFGARPYVCQTCHVDAGGGSDCASMVPSRAPCLNPYGTSYYSSGYAATTGSNPDLDSWTNTYEINTAQTLPGWPEGATEASCNMETCAYSVAATTYSAWGSYQNCAENVQCRSYHTSSQRYYFEFRCRPGTSGVAGTSAHNWGCTDINECAGNPCSPGVCNQDSLASWAAPGYYCTGCPSGYSLNVGSTACVLQNECLANLDNCHASASCFDPSSALSNYTCTCPAGYSGNGRTGLGNTGCTDINECAANPCGPNGVSCSQTPIGSWSSPGYSCTCATNYGFNGTTCVLTNECTTLPTPCTVGLTTCLDPTPALANGDAQCTCFAGYTGNGRVAGTNCTNINECMTGANNCSANATCMDTPGSFTCACRPGTTGNGVTCTDTNECAAPQPCGVGGSCAQIPLVSWAAPGYNCTCTAGYQNNGTTCVLQNECLANLDDCVARSTCNDPSAAVGDFECPCNAGYTGNGRASGTGCTDVDECANDEDNCAAEATCTNTVASYTCACNPGFDGDGETCVDIDECSSGANDCSPFADCANTTGSFECTCRTGFQGTGTNCIDVDECVVDDPCLANEVCMNQLGTEPKCECVPGFTRVESTGLCTRACGDGVRGLGEGCDDANTEVGDGCDATCLVEPGWACFEPPGNPSQCTNRCGDGVIDYPAEECDQGETNSDTVPDACRTVCRPATCGDGVLDTGEACDDGEGNSATAENACRPTCERAFCGDGIVDDGEVCDPGVGLAIEAERCAQRCYADAGLGGRGGCSVTVGQRGSAPVWAALFLLGLAGLTRAGRGRRR